jgi:hypothetical protein
MEPEINVGALRQTKMLPLVEEGQMELKIDVGALPRTKGVIETAGSGLPETGLELRSRIASLAGFEELP